MKTNSLEQIKNYLIPVFSIIAVLVMIPVFIMPQLDKIAESSKIINKNQDRLNSLEDKAEALDKLAEDKDRIDADIRVVEQALPVDKSLAPLVSGLQQLAINSGLGVKSFKIAPGRTATESARAGGQTTAQTAPRTPAGTTEQSTATSRTDLVFQMNLRGGSEQFGTFLTAIEKAKRILVLQEFKATYDDNIRAFEFEIFLQAPYAPLPKLSEDQEAEALPTLSAQNKNLIEDLNSSEFQDVTLPTTPGPRGVVDPFQ
jgi:Tfp pilus assembly protein PilO